MQAGIGRRRLLEQLPGAEEVGAGAEAGLADDQAPAGGQGGAALGQLGVGEEHVAGLAEAVFAGKVDIVELARQGLALFRPVELGVVDSGHGERCWQPGARRAL
ncbi:hypothetical protein D3C78_1571760 [compost metagenome]